MNSPKTQMPDAEVCSGFSVFAQFKNDDASAGASRICLLDTFFMLETKTD